MKTVLNILSTLFILASPWVLYWTLTHHSVDVAAIVLVGWVIVRVIPIMLSARREQRMAALQLPAIGLVFALLGSIFDNGTWLMILPSATQAAFALAFLRSLTGTPLIEHFARMMKHELGVRQQAHCRRWTVIWGVYLMILAALGLVLARWAPLRVWTIYVGVLNYVLIGLLFAVEYVIRKLTFREYGRNPLDWVLSKLFPPARSGVT
jgi:uncharacterized membrane protein